MGNRLAQVEGDGPKKFVSCPIVLHRGIKMGSLLKTQHIFFASIASLVIAFLAGCGTTTPGGTLTITPSASSLLPNAQVQLHAMLTLPSGETTDVTSSAVWNSSNPVVAAVNANGTLNSIAVGQSTLTASWKNAAGNITVHVVSPKVSAISITPTTASLITGATQQFKAIATYADSSTGDVTSSVTWSVSDSSVASISAGGLLTSVAPGATNVTASMGNDSASVRATVTYPIPVYLGADLSSYPSYNVDSFSASGSASTYSCSGRQGSTLLTCSGSTDFKPGEGIRVAGGGAAPRIPAMATAPQVQPQGHLSGGSHTYCYVVDAVDPMGGISTPSPETCVGNEPDLGVNATYNFLSAASAGGPSPSYLWYVSEDGGPFYLLNVAKFTASAADYGQRIGSRGGWPDGLPYGNPNIAKNEDLFSTVEEVNGSLLTTADTLASTLNGAEIDHDDTQAVESAILAAVNTGGGTVVFGPGSFNIRRPVFSIVVNNSYAYPKFSTNLNLDPWWAYYTYLYIPNGAAGNIDIEGAGRETTLVTGPDYGGVSALLAVGLEQRQGAVGTPILAMQNVPKGSPSITLSSQAEAATLAPGEDIYIYSGSFEQTPTVDTGGVPNNNHFSELNTIASISNNVINLVYPTSKRYFNDGSSSFGVTELPVTPHNIELQHFNLATWQSISGMGNVIGMLINDIQVQGVVSQGLCGGGFKRGMTIENSSWTFGEGTLSWGQEDEYDQFTDLAFLNDQITGYAAPDSEGSSQMARIYATEGTSQVLFEGNTFDHVSLYADQTTEYFVQSNTFTDGIVTAGVMYGAYTPQYDAMASPDLSFLSFDSQQSIGITNNTFTITSGFNPPWVIRAGDFSSGNIANNIINYSGGEPLYLVGTFNGAVKGNTITVQSPALHNIFALVGDDSPITPMSTFTVQGNDTSANKIDANIFIPSPGFTLTTPVCMQNNTVDVSSGTALNAAKTIINQSCP